MDTIPHDKIKRASEGLRAIAHEVRLAVLCNLMHGPMCVQELVSATGTSQSNLSQHLTKMRMMGIVENDKRGQQVFYHIADPEWREIIHALKHLYCPELCTQEQA